MREHMYERHTKDRQKLKTAEQIAEMCEVRIVNEYRSALITRQIGEAIHIRGSQGVILNDKDE